MHILNIIINILRSVPFLILMICVFPLTRAIVGTTVGTKATIVPLVVAAFPFVARLVETTCVSWTRASWKLPRAWARLPSRSSPRS